MSSGVHQPQWLSAEEPATDRQLETVRSLIQFDEMAENQEAQEYVKRKLEDGMSQQEAWELVGSLGARIVIEKKKRRMEAAQRELDRLRRRNDGEE